VKGRNQNQNQLKQMKFGTICHFKVNQPKRRVKSKTMERQDLLNIGFKEIPYFTIGNSLIFDIGRFRYISVSSLGTPNEFVWICQASRKDLSKVTDLVCIHNYDYDGYITLDKVKSIIEVFKSKN
jgi:hypothetical protein